MRRLATHEHRGAGQQQLTTMVLQPELGSKCCCCCWCLIEKSRTHIHIQAARNLSKFSFFSSSSVNTFFRQTHSGLAHLWAGRITIFPFQVRFRIGTHDTCTFHYLLRYRKLVGIQLGPRRWVNIERYFRQLRDKSETEISHSLRSSRFSFQKHSLTGTVADAC